MQEKPLKSQVFLNRSTFYDLLKAGFFQTPWRAELSDYEGMQKSTIFEQAREQRIQESVLA